MLARSTVHGTRRAGTIAIVLDGDPALTFGFRFSRGTGRAKHDLHVEPVSGAYAATPRLASALSDIAARAAEAHGAVQSWRIDDETGAVTAGSAADAERAA